MECCLLVAAAAAAAEEEREDVVTCSEPSLVIGELQPFASLADASHK